jgi:hypothetical protein
MMKLISDEEQIREIEFMDLQIEFAKRRVTFVYRSEEHCLGRARQHSITTLAKRHQFVAMATRADK